MHDIVLQREVVKIPQKENNRPFIELIKDELGQRQWKKLHKDIIARFTSSKTSNNLRYIGVVDWVYCSPLGMIFAKLLRPFELLPENNARDVQFDFKIKNNKTDLVKQRRYYLNKGSPFTFRSLFSKHPFLHEEFTAGLGMKLKLSVVNNDLLFRDKGYFWRIKNWRIPIPAWLAVGRFELLHRNIDAKRFQVIIRIAHPLFGLMFYQRGEFYKFQS